MIRNSNFNKLFGVLRVPINIRHNTTSSLDIEKIEKESTGIDVIDEEARLREEQIQLSRNKSRLRDSHRSFLNEQNPYPEAQFWHHGTVKYNRRLYGRYGQASGVNPALCWPTKQELEETLEYEKIAYPFTIPQMIEDAKIKRKQKEEDVRIRQEGIVKKMEKLETWKRELKEKIAKKEVEVHAARARREKLIEEVRRHFGYTVDPKDDKFKEMLEKKEKEQKKAMKEARKKMKEEKMMSKLLGTDKEKQNKKGDNAESKSEENVDKKDEDDKNN